MATKNIYESIFNNATFFTNQEEESTGNPITIDEVLKGEEKEQWQKAIDVEMETLKNMGTWELAELPEERKAIGCKWVFVKKRDKKGKLIKYKAQLVTQGFLQKPGINFNNDRNFAPIMQFKTLRTLLAFAASTKWDVKQFDVKGAYLHVVNNMGLGIPGGYMDRGTPDTDTDTDFCIHQKLSMLLLHTVPNK